MIKKVKDFLLVNRTTRQTVAKNTFWLTVSNLGGRLLRAVIIIYSARVLGAAEWGLFSYAVSFVALITVFADFGIGPILTREASRTNDPLKRSQIVSTTFFLKMALLAIGVLVVIFLAPSLSANSPAILKRSSARLASPCSLAAKAAHFAITPSCTTFSLNASLDLLFKIS